MNRTYALVWNPSLATWTVADEHARRRGKGAGAVLAAALLLPALAFAADLPAGGTVVSGSGQIGTPNGNQLVIDQASNKLAINWQSFDIGKGNKVTFNQPGTDSIALNRVLGADGSKIMGQLDANGRVFIINPNGVLFGQGAQVNVGGLVASTLDISDSDFAAGNYQFKGEGSNARVINNGTITAADGGSVALLGGTVSNNGVIVANQGSVALAAGNKVTLDFAGDGLLNVQVDEAVVDALVENHKLIKADGGQVLLTADAGEALLKTVVNNTGVIEAQTLGEKDGKIVLLGSFDGGSVQVAGTLDASAPNGGKGGFIETSGAHVKVADSAKVTTKAQNGKTGTWLIDPNDFTVAASGGDMSGAAVSTAVQNNNFEIQTATMGTAGGNGDIHIKDAVSWSSNNTLTLTAERNININSAITATGAAAGLVMNYGGSDYQVAAPVTLSGANASLAINGTAYTLIHSMAQLDDIDSTGLAGHYALAQNLNASGTTYDHALVGTLFGSEFTGTFAGLGHTISDLTIDASGSSYIGLFGVNSGIIRDIGLGGGSITGADGSNSSVGGLVGFNLGSIRNAFSTGNVNGNGGDNIGGLVGYNAGQISNAYATGNVTGGSTSRFVGGLVGANETGTISNAYATGNVSGRFYVGGLAGTNDLNWGGSINNAYATGSVTGDAYLGGLVGAGRGPVDSSFYATTDSNGNAINNGNSIGSGKTWAELNDASTFATWDFANTWRMTATGAGTDGYAFYGLPTLQGVTRKTDYQYFDSGLGTQANPWTLTDWQQLQNINTNAATLAGYFTLNADLGQDSLGYLTLASASANGGEGWNPLGNFNAAFTGTFDGQNHTVSDLVINRSTNYVGLFGYTGSGSVIRNLGLLDGSVTTTGSYAGGLVGRNLSSLSNVYATGSVEGDGDVGGLVGSNSGTINNAYATGDVTGNSSVGGLAGYTQNTIDYAYATGNVIGNTYVGGLVGYNQSAISNTYASGSVTGTSNVGGLVGWNNNATSTSSFYATTDANGDTINNGGDATTNGFSGNSNGSGKTTEELTLASTFAGWNIASTGGTNAIWRIYEGQTGPLLRSFLQSVTLTTDASNGNKTYDGTAATGTATYTSSLGSDLDASELLGSLGYTSNSKNAGTYNSSDGTLTIGGLYSGQQGYDISYADASLTIDKASISAVSGITATNRTYDGSTDATLNYDGAGFTGLIGGDELSVASATGTFADKNAGAGKTVDITGITLEGADAGNYTLADDSATATADIERATLTITASDASKTYGLTTNLNGYQIDGLFSGDAVSAVTLASDGVGTTAMVGDYLIVASDAQGTGLDNYAITYAEGTLTVGNDIRTTPPYLGVLASNGQTVSTEAKQQAQEPLVLSQDMLVTNSLDDHLNLQIVNHGIRLPEGI